MSLSSVVTQFEFAERIFRTVTSTSSFACPLELGLPTRRSAQTRRARRSDSWGRTAATLGQFERPEDAPQHLVRGFGDRESIAFTRGMLQAWAGLIERAAEAYDR